MSFLFICTCWLWTSCSFKVIINLNKRYFILINWIIDSLVDIRNVLFIFKRFLIDLTIIFNYWLFILMFKESDRFSSSHISFIPNTLRLFFGFSFLILMCMIIILFILYNNSSCTSIALLILIDVFFNTWATFSQHMMFILNQFD